MELDRRSFVSGALCAAVGGTFAAEAAAGGERPPSPAVDPALAVLISDLHVSGEDAAKHTRPELEKTVAAILALSPRPARVVVFGDVADTHGKACDYAAAKPLLEPLFAAGFEVSFMMGNHDHRAAFADAWPESAASSLVPGRFVHVVPVGGVDLVLMDSLWESPGVGTFNEVDGKVDGGQLEWLAEWGAKATRPFVVCTHHDGRQMKSFAKAAMKSSPKMCGYLHGHRHCWMPDVLHVWGSAARAVRSVGLPSTGAWGDIGFALFRAYSDRAELTLVERDFYFPKPAPAAANPSWKAVLAENRNARVTFFWPCGSACNFSRNHL